MAQPSLSPFSSPPPAGRAAQTAWTADLPMTLGPADLNRTVARLVDLYDAGTIDRSALAEIVELVCSAYIEEVVERRVEELFERALGRGLNARLAALPNG